MKKMQAQWKMWLTRILAFTLMVTCPLFPMESSAETSAASFDDQLNWGIKAMGLDLLMTAALVGEEALNQPLLIAVLDSGCDVNHEVFTGRISPLSRSFMSGREDITDNGGHGTGVAGAIAEATPSSVQLLILKVLDENGYAPDAQFQEAILYALEQCADLITMSIDVPSPNPVTQDFRIWGDGIQRCLEANVPFFIAAGNEATDTAYIYPAGDPRVITVSALQPDGSFYPYSNHGSTIQFCAPGKYIRTPKAGTENEYSYMDGTSISAPLMAAAAAWLMMRQPEITISELTDQLIACAEDLGESGWDEFYGYGMPVVSRAILRESPDPIFLTSRSAARVVSATKGINKNEEANNLFGIITDKWCVLMEDGAFVEWEEENPIQPSVLRLLTANDNSMYPGRNPVGMKLYARDDEAKEWTLIWRQQESDVMADTDFTVYDFTISDAQKPCRFYRLEISGTTGSNVMQLACLELAE